MESQFNPLIRQKILVAQVAAVGRMRTSRSPPFLQKARARNLKERDAQVIDLKKLFQQN